MKTNYSAQTQCYTIFLCSPTQAQGKRGRRGNTDAGETQAQAITGAHAYGARVKAVALNVVAVALNSVATALNVVATALNAMTHKKA